MESKRVGHDWVTNRYTGKCQERRGLLIEKLLPRVKLESPLSGPMYTLDSIQLPLCPEG